MALSLSSMALVKSEWKVVLPASTAPLRSRISLLYLLMASFSYSISFFR
jgi:hypothetical protein